MCGSGSSRDTIHDNCPSQDDEPLKLSLMWCVLEVRIGNDIPTFNTAHLAGPVFFFRDAVGDHATVCTAAERAH